MSNVTQAPETTLLHGTEHAWGRRRAGAQLGGPEPLPAPGGSCLPLGKTPTPGRCENGKMGKPRKVYTGKSGRRAQNGRR